jgi:hypothetical protein
MALHSNISPSAASRWTACPGSVALCATLPPQKTSVHAAEGTACHGLGEKLLKKEISKADIIKMEGQTVMVEDFEIEITEEMIDAAIFYYDTVQGVVEELKGMKRGTPIILEVEERVIAKSVDEHVYGTADATIYQKGNILVVADLKYGKGVVVDAVNNKQLIIYAIAAMDTLAGWAFDKVRMGIIQPRARHEEGPVRWWEVSVKFLKEEAAKLKLAVAETRNPKAAFNSGSHCRWCAGKSQCPAMFKAVQETAKVDFAKDPLPYEGALRDVRTMTTREMALALEWDEAISAWFDAIRERAKELLASGQEFPGYKLVDGKSNRKWVDEAAVSRDFGALFEVYEKKLLSPAKLEKIVGKGKLDSYTFKPEASKTLAKISDPRPATKSSAAEDFGAALPHETNELDGLL